MGLDILYGVSTASGLMNPLLIPELFPEDFNQDLRLQLQRSAEWRLCLDEHYLPGSDWDQYSDTGFVYYTYTNDRDWAEIAARDPARGYFNGQAESILYRALEHMGIKEAVIHRVMWNYYNRASQGILHSDHQQPGLHSMVYNLSATDGGTEIEGKFYQGNSGTAVIFPSEQEHRGFGPTNQPRRFVLNCIFSADFSDK